MPAGDGVEEVRDDLRVLRPARVVQEQGHARKNRTGTLHPHPRGIPGAERALGGPFVGIAPHARRYPDGRRLPRARPVRPIHDEVRCLEDR